MLLHLEFEIGCKTIKFYWRSWWSQLFYSATLSSHTSSLFFAFFSPPRYFLVSESPFQLGCLTLATCQVHVHSQSICSSCLNLCCSLCRAGDMINVLLVSNRRRGKKRMRQAHNKQEGPRAHLSC